MPDVIFNEPRITEKQRQEMCETSGFANWLMKKGIAKNEKEAILILLVFSAIAIAVSIFLFFKNIETPPPSSLPAPSTERSMSL